MRRFWLLIFTLSCLWPVATQAAVKYDFGVEQEDIRLSGGQVIIGKTMNVVARIHNYGAEDAKGYATFLAGGNVIGTSQEISILAGTYDDAWIEFTVPTGPFNVRVEVTMTGGVNDQVSSNNVDQTSLITPDIDTDRDGIGNLSDVDDDNDGVSDVDEQARGTDPLRVDTDGDGHWDNSDLFPLDPKRWQEIPPQVAVISEIAPTPPPPVAALPAAVPGSIVDTESPAADQVDDGILVSGKLQVMAEPAVTSTVTVTATSLHWGRYAFATDVSSDTADQYLYTWSFGDGDQSAERLPVHRFRRPGTYHVAVGVEDAERNITWGDVTVVVPWYQWLNGGLVLLLIIIIGGGGFVLAKLRQRFVPQDPIIIPAVKTSRPRRVAKNETIE